MSICTIFDQQSNGYHHYPCPKFTAYEPLKQIVKDFKSIIDKFNFKNNYKIFFLALSVLAGMTLAVKMIRHCFFSNKKLVVDLTADEKNLLKFAKKILVVAEELETKNISINSSGSKEKFIFLKSTNQYFDFQQLAEEVENARTWITNQHTGDYLREDYLMKLRLCSKGLELLEDIINNIKAM